MVYVENVKNDFNLLYEKCRKNNRFIYSTYALFPLIS